MSQSWNYIIFKNSFHFCNVKPIFNFRCRLVHLNWTKQKNALWKLLDYPLYVQVKLSVTFIKIESNGQIANTFSKRHSYLSLLLSILYNNKFQDNQQLNEFKSNNINFW